MISITNVFEIDGMPSSEKEQNELINVGIDVTNIHVHNNENGKYYVVRVTTVDESKFQAIRKLEPLTNEEDKQVCLDVLNVISQMDTETDLNVPTA